ncbi:tRNA (N6-threonylcarbamoyladenosine(37)-N6)-methyltransferase TrmO [Sandaracinus amylolyticus]|uniref:TsaA-like domain-containing protein n=1 Tax=Sandaracinus amylolyticus TaxID=927083 RepID=A0A0F6VYV5_9BACT|nr:tRNA (N6-threonylcarbamoyladenosine(37)-N6)-methyltransferase TrmO [Sandaracinus amylolyticus]AKF03150.1 Hypothetical protein DB32_000299 [Sandaracinus amylolyticus]
MNDDLTIHPVGIVRSGLRALADAPRQGDEGAPDAWIELDPRFVPASEGLAIGHEILVLTWLHRADRALLRVHPRDDTSRPLHGVFATRSADRPNPIGLHRVRIVEITNGRLRVAPLEAIDGTPVIDVKPILGPGER